MAIDRFIEWGEPPEWGPPTPEKLAAVAKDFLGEGWETKIEPFPKKNGCWIQIVSDYKCSYDLASEYPERAHIYDVQEGDEPFYRWFQVYFPAESTGERTSVITRHVDSFTNALADRYAKIIARWWNGTVEQEDEFVALRTACQDYMDFLDDPKFHPDRLDNYENQIFEQALECFQGGKEVWDKVNERLK